MSVAGIPTYIHQQNNDQNGIQTVIVNLRGLSQKNGKTSSSLSSVERLLLLLAKHYQTVTITFAPKSGLITIKVRGLVVETLVSEGGSDRKDLPELLREDIAQPMFLAMECALDLEIPEEDFSKACYSGSINRHNGEAIVFEVKPEYQAIPHEWSILEQSNKSIHLKNNTTRVVLTLNQHGIPYRGDALSSNEVMDSPPDKQQQQQQREGHGASGSNSNSQFQSSGSSFSGTGASLPDDDDPNNPERSTSEKLKSSHCKSKEYYNMFLDDKTPEGIKREDEDAENSSDGYLSENELDYIRIQDGFERDSYKKRYGDPKNKNKPEKRNNRQQVKEDQRQSQEDRQQREKYLPDDSTHDQAPDGGDVEIDNI